MGTAGRWEPLDLNREGLPRLLVKYVIREAGYTVSITDLANIWIESLSKPEITRNAEEQSCSINPAGDADQLQILLEQIRDILHHKDGTSVRIALHSVDDLTLALRAPLPFPLPPFEWTMVLSKAISRELVSEVISPLLLLAHQQQQQLGFLLGQLRKKDHAISRLLDKMEATNTDLGSVFPGVSGGRNSQRSMKRNQVAKNVPGLAPFQPGSELQHSGGTPSTDSLYAVLRDVSADMTPILAEPSSHTWWLDMAKQPESIAVNVPMPEDLDSDDTDDDLDFQTQTIPEQLQRQRPADISSPARSSRNLQRLLSANDDSTDDENVTSSPPGPQNLILGQTETPVPESPSRCTNTLARRIGAVGDQSSSQIPLPSPPSLRTRTAMSPTPPSMLPPQSQASPMRRRKLGGIGRGCSQMQPSQPLLNRWSSQALTTLEEESQPSGTLDSAPMVCEFHENTTEVPQTRTAKRRASEEREPTPRETSVERANRKRQELKQNVNEKPKVPVKKRRF